MTRFLSLENVKIKISCFTKLKEIDFFKQHYKVLSNDYTKLFNDNTFPVSLPQMSLVAVFLIKDSILTY